VVHRHPEHLTGGRDATTFQRATHPTGAVDGSVRRRIGEDGEHVLGRSVDRRGRGNALGFHTDMLRGMPVYALWSAPRARSTAFFRSMLERGDLLALHEPLEGLIYFRSTEVQGRIFESPQSLLAWLLEETADIGVFMKETTDHQVWNAVLANPRFLAEARHAFLIRRPDEIAASLFPLAPTMGITDIGLERLHRLYTAVRDAPGHPPLVIDSDDLVDRPDATMAAYCAEVGLPFIPEALTWEPGDRPEWRRSARWHVDVGLTAGFERRPRAYEHTVETSDDLARFVAHHQSFYEELRAHRLDVTRGSDR
jgi:hypothetical protein